MNSLTFRLPAAVLVSILFVGLGCQSAPEDSEHARFAGPSGAADVSGVEEGGYLALAVLHLANTATDELLRNAVGLNSRTVENLLQARSQGSFASLAALDEVAWFGPVSFDRMVAYTEGNGLVGSCGDGVLQSNEACDGTAACSPTCQNTSGSSSAMIVEIRLVDSGDGFEGDEDWTFDEDEYGWVYEETVRTNALPFYSSIGDCYVSLGADGSASVEYSYGDADVTAQASTKFPTTGQLLSGDPGTQYELNLSGGDHASGYWGLQGTLRITLD